MPPTLFPSPWLWEREGLAKDGAPRALGVERGSHTPSPKQASNGANPAISGTTEAYSVPALSRRESRKIIRTVMRTNGPDIGQRQKSQS